MLVVCALWPRTRSAEAAEPRVTVGVALPYGIMPGGGGASWTVGLQRASRWDVRLGPELAAFSRVNDNANVFVGAATDVRRQTRRHRWHAFRLAAGPMAESRILGVTVDIGSGDTSQDREWRGHLLFDLQYRFTREPPGRVGWYLGPTYGRRFSFAVESAAYFSLVGGISIPLGARAPEAR